MAKIRLAYNITKRPHRQRPVLEAEVRQRGLADRQPDAADGDVLQPYMGRVDPGANRWFFLGATIPSYDANIFRASLTYTF